MQIKPFKVEEWMNAYEADARFNIAETCVDSVSLDELFSLTGEDKAAFLQQFCAKRLTYGDIEGAPLFRQGVCGLYKTIHPENIVPTHGASGANHHVFCSMLETGDRIVSIMPTYQQLYSIPESFQANVQLLHLKAENGYLPDLEELRRLVTPGTKMICINNPNNPTGALMSRELLQQIVEIARAADAWVLCDEVYRHLTQADGWCESIVDLYEKGISVSSMSKVFSLAGLRLGWIATRDRDVVRACLSHRDYNLISCGMFDEAVAGIALSHSERLLERNRGIVRENLAVLDNWVRQQAHVSYVKPQAGTTALVYYDLDLPSRIFCDEMYHQTGAFVTPGECFEMEYCMRIGYACDPQVLKDGLQAIDAYIEKKLAEGAAVRKELHHE
ncbi:MAG: aminotransferase [Oscillospiraceae bacterium]|jgi:aspartate/methionine/tyrosine aminotransferase|nr:aminotransferase [Oscillospiraceae bacterium]